MRDLNKDFSNRNIDYNKLVEFGFNKKDNNYILEKEISNHFKVIITISNTKKYSKVIDLKTLDEYILGDLKEVVGSLAIKIRDEVDNIVTSVINNCTTLDVFNSKQAREITDKVIEVINLRNNNVIDDIYKDKIFPGYHMNKKSWITIPLDGRIDTKIIYELIDNSYKISLTKG